MSIVLNLLECRSCGKAFWFETELSGAIDEGPCCKGLPILDAERFPTERAALKGYAGWRKERSAALKAQLDAIKKQEVVA